MLLKKVHIKDFRCIEYSEELLLDKVTCLVGKNESGKTAILKALYRIKPDNKKEIFSQTLDFPKKKWKPNQPIPTVPVIDTEWELDDLDKEAIETHFGLNVINSEIIKISVGYDNKRKIEVSINEENLIKNLIEKNSAEIPNEIQIASLDHLKSYLNGLTEKSANQTKLLDHLNKNYQEKVENRIYAILDECIPTFLYFDQYTRLPGNVSLQDFNQRRDQNILNDNDKIFTSLLSLAGTTIETISGAKTFEEFNSSLKAVSNQISDQIFKYWSQNKHLDVELKFDSAKPEDPPPFNSGYIFRTRINNRRHRADTSFDERSSGFVWFFSFLVWFYQLRETYKKKLVILLDEPGLTLHARAQADLLRYINEQLKPEYQVVYTTHSPFMIDTDNILSARTVEDVVTIDTKTKEEQLLGTKVSSKILSKDRDTISPLQNALDYELTQSLFIGKNNILVEGPSDFLYLKWFSQQLQVRGRTALDYRWTISIVGGIDKIPGYFSLFQANLLHIAALIDVQKGQKQKVENLTKLLEPNHLLLTTNYLGSQKKDEADIEDVLGNKFYISLVNLSYRLTHQLAYDESKVKSPNKRIVLEIEDYFKILPPQVSEFDHFLPSQHLYSLPDAKELDDFDNALLNMENLIKDLNKLLEDSK